MFQTSRNFSSQRYKSPNKSNFSLEKMPNNQSLEKIKKFQHQIRALNINGSSKLKKIILNEDQPTNKLKQINRNAIKNLIDDYFKEDIFLQNKVPLLRNKILSKRIIKDRRISNNNIKNQPIELELSKSVNVLQNQIKENPELRKTGTTLRWSISSLQNHLPPIHQQTEGPDQNDCYNQFPALNLTSTSSFTSKASRLSQYMNHEPEIKQKRMVSFENEIFYIFIITENNRPVARMIQYKEKGLQILERQLKIQKYNITHIWKQSKYNNHSFMTSIRPPIKDLICKIVPDQINTQQLKIIPKNTYKRLVANHCQQLILMLKQFCLQLKKAEGKVLNNKINPSNIFLVKDYKLSLAQWGYSSFRDQFNIQENKFQTRKYGILRGERDWFVTPQYLAPQIIKQIMQKEQIDIWAHKGSPDIWSLGITLFQILTLIPIWINAKVSILSKASIVRAGLLCIPDRDLSKLLQKQEKIQKNILNCLQTQLLASQKNENLIKLIYRMVERNPQQRISLDQIIKSL